MNHQQPATTGGELKVPAEPESAFQNIIGIHLGACIPTGAQPISELFTINANLEPEQAEPFIKGARTLDDSLADFDKAVDGLRQTNEAAKDFTTEVQSLSAQLEKVGYATDKRLHQIYDRWRDDGVIGASLPEVVEFVSSWMTPAEVFSEEALIKWAENYGYQMSVRRFEE